MNFLSRLFLFVILPIVLAAAAAVGSAYYWVHGAVTLPAPTVDVLVPPGATASTISRLLSQSGVQINPRYFSWLARFGHFDTKLKAGGYQVVQGDTPWTILRRMAMGDMTQRQLTLVEGWNLRQIRTALAQHPDIRHTLDQVSDAQLAERLGVSSSNVEGLFFPDTYIFPIGTTDLDILQRAYRAQQQILGKAWEQRAADLPIASPYEALVLASLVEKETGSPSDRARIAGVFVNRLRAGMPLQTDPARSTSATCWQIRPGTPIHARACRQAQSPALAGHRLPPRSSRKSMAIITLCPVVTAPAFSPRHSRNTTRMSRLTSWAASHEERARIISYS